MTGSDLVMACLTIGEFIFSELGDKHSQENPALLSFSVLFFRWHNHLADKFMEESNDGADMTFARTRHWVIASLQVSCLSCGTSSWHPVSSRR